MIEKKAWFIVETLKKAPKDAYKHDIIKMSIKPFKQEDIYWFVMTPKEAVFLATMLLKQISKIGMNDKKEWL
jgi:hypothetical protein